MEVFMKANFLANNELEEQKNSEFYMWYKSEMRAGFYLYCNHFFPVSLFLLQVATAALCLRIDFKLSEPKH